MALPNVDPGDYQLCATGSGLPPVCAYLHVLPASSPSPEASPTVPPTAAPSPSPSPSPSAAAPAAPPPTSGSSPLGYLIQPPFVFFPALLLLAAVGWLVYWIWSLRPPPALGDDVVFEHRAPIPRERPLDVDLVETPAPAPPPSPPVYETAPTPEPEEPASPPVASDLPAEGDLPPDLPTASD